jgi:hypothetical protein
MKHRFLPWLSALTISAAGFAADYEPPRTSAGHPDLEGVWTNASLTRLSRSSDMPGLVLTPDEAAERAGRHFHNVRAAKDNEPSDPNRGAPPKVDSLPPVGNYDAGWVEPGTQYGVVGGEIRSSWIIDPPDGKVPFSEAARERMLASRDRRSTIAGPEVMALGERCLLGFGGTAGPPMLNVLYNNYYRIVQTPTHVMILVEMVHDARIIRLDSQHSAAGNPKWLGDSVGRWDGDTLVVETRHFHPERATSGPLPYSSDAVVTERLTRVSEEQILYEFSVQDEQNYTHAIRGEMSFNAASGKLYEYACHEGNYAMGGIMRGARLLESEATDDD